MVLCLAETSEYFDTYSASIHGHPMGVLYPRTTDSRQVLPLDATWKFRLAPELDPEIGFRNKWFTQPLEEVIN